MKVLVLDNYDSFTYNIVHILKEHGCIDLDIFRNDKISIKEVARYDKILLSPGPGLPVESGILMDLIRTYGATKSILGVCLGHQAIGEVYGADLFQLDRVYHGHTSVISITTEDYLFNNIPTKTAVGRYHSWALKNLPKELEEIAIDDQGQIMAIRHKKYDLRGVQFHPESIMTPEGKNIIKNWLDGAYT